MYVVRTARLFREEGETASFVPSDEFMGLEVRLKLRTSIRR